jgi:hypothetical protein
VSLSRRQLRALRGLEDELAVSDPGLHAFFVSFASRAGDGQTPRELPRADHTASWLARLRRGRPGRPGRSAQATGDTPHAENWNEP